MYEYMTLEADGLPGSAQLSELCKGGWRLLQIVPFDGHVYLYLIRDAEN